MSSRWIRMAFSGFFTSWATPEVRRPREASFWEYVTIDSTDQLNDNVDKFGGKIVGIEPGSGLMRDTANMPLLYYSYHDLVSSKLSGWEPNVMDVHPSRFVSKE